MQANPLGHSYYLTLKPLPSFQHSDLLQSKEQQKMNRAVLPSSHSLSLGQLEALKSHLEQKTDLIKCIDLFQLRMSFLISSGLPQGYSSAITSTRDGMRQAGS